MWNYNRPKKTCCHCKKEFEATPENFYKKANKYKLNDGTIVKGYKLTTVCKKCHGIITTIKGRERRCKQHGIELSQYEQWKKDHLGKTSLNQKYSYFDKLNLSPIELRRIKIFIRKHKYSFTTYEQFLIDWKEQHLSLMKNAQITRCITRKSNIFNDLPDGYDFYRDLPPDKLKEILRKRPISNAVIANWLGISIKDAPKELIEAKRAIVNLHYAIKGGKRIINRCKVG